MGNVAFTINNLVLMSTWLYRILLSSVNANLRKWNVLILVDATLNNAKIEMFKTRTGFI